MESTITTILEVAKVNGKKPGIYCGGEAMAKIDAHHCIDMVRFTILTLLGSCVTRFPL